LLLLLLLRLLLLLLLLLIVTARETEVKQSGWCGCLLPTGRERGTGCACVAAWLRLWLLVVFVLASASARAALLTAVLLESSEPSGYEAVLSVHLLMQSSFKSSTFFLSP
jgi:hypothetical protein